MVEKSRSDAERRVTRKESRCRPRRTAIARVAGALVLVPLLFAQRASGGDLETLTERIESHYATYSKRATESLAGWQQRWLAGDTADVTTVEVSPDAASRTGGVQEALDRLPSTGGIVSLRPGMYAVSRAIALPSNVVLTGAPGAVLDRVPFSTATLAADAAAGATSVVAPGHRFARGAAVAVRDVATFGWNTTRATVVSVDGDTIRLDVPLKKDYAVERRAFITDASPVLEAFGRTNVVVRGVAITGHGDAEGFTHPGGIVDFTDSAIQFRDVINAVVEQVVIERYQGEAISLQSGKNILARNNTVSRCAASGIHIGTGIADSVVTNNTSTANAGDGIYFCASVQNVLVQRNVATANGGNGIGGLGDVSDRNNIVYRNTITENALNGIAIHESGNLVFANEIRGNAKAGAAYQNLKYEPSAMVNVVLANTIEP